MAKGTIYFIISPFIFISSSYAIHIMIARNMGPSLYGLFGIVLSILSVIDLFIRSGIRKAVSKFVSEQKNRFGILKTALHCQLAASTLITLLYFLSSNIIASFFGDRTLVRYIQFSSLCIVPYALLSVYHGYLNGLREFGREALSSTLYALLKFCSILSILFLLHSVTGLFIGYAISATMAAIIARQFASKFMRHKEDELFPIRRLLLFAFPVAVISITEVLLINIDIFLIKRFLQDDSLTGLYVTASNLSRIPWHIAGAFYMTLFPSIAMAMTKPDVALARRYIVASLRYLFVVICPIAFIISASSSSLISLLYSERFLAASEPLSVLIFGILLVSVFISFTTIISASGKPYTALFFNLFLLPVNISFNFVLIPKYGLMGAAFASTLSYLIGVIMAGGLAFIRFGNCIPVLSIIRILFASYTITFLMPHLTCDAVGLLGRYVLAVFIYIGILIVLKELSLQDVDGFKQMIRRP